MAITLVVSISDKTEQFFKFVLFYNLTETGISYLYYQTLPNLRFLLQYHKYSIKSHSILVSIETRVCAGQPGFISLQGQ